MVDSLEARQPERDAQSMIDGIPVQAALLDEDGTIVAVNTHWRQFADDNGYGDPASGLGLNYVGTCQGAEGAFSSEARIVATELKAVLTGARDEFSLVYPCHSPTERRWFRLLASSTRDPAGAVILHFNITPERLAEERLTASRIEVERRLSRMEQDLEDSSREELANIGREIPGGNGSNGGTPEAGDPTEAVRAAYRAVIEATVAPTGTLGDAAIQRMAREVAEELAAQRVDAGAVARLHASVLAPIVRVANRDRRVWITHESRMAFIGVLGHLANLYRTEEKD